jgi:phosphogluconate dehydratase
MRVHQVLQEVANRILSRSERQREAYLEKINKNVRVQSMSCSNRAHSLASFSTDEKTRILAKERKANIGIISAYNDLLSAHAPYVHYPDMIKKKLNALDCSVQFAAGVPAMCDGITQGLPGMELSLFSREVIAQSVGVGLSHAIFDGVIGLGICDKIVPGLLMGGLCFGQLPFLFLPSGPMPSSAEFSNTQKAQARKAFAEKKIKEAELLKIEMSCYGTQGTCTFYGTANTNQVMMEFLGLHLPWASFVAPDTPLRQAFNEEALTRFAGLLSEPRFALGRMINEKSLVNALVGLAATGGSTNHTIHLVAIAKMAGFTLTWDDFHDVFRVVPLLAKIYPNGEHDVNDFHAAGGCPLVIRELFKQNLLFNDVFTMLGEGFERYAVNPMLTDQQLVWQEQPALAVDAEPPCHDTKNTESCVRSIDQPFLAEGGLKLVTGNLGRGIAKISAVAEKYWYIRARAKVFHSQESLHLAYQQGALKEDFVAVLVFQGPKVAGMPELHQLMPVLASLQDQGYAVALVTDGRLSGASAKVPSVLHLYPEAIEGGLLSKVRTGDWIVLDLIKGSLTLQVSAEELKRRISITPNMQDHQSGFGRELFSVMRHSVSSPELGATIFNKPLVN